MSQEKIRVGVIGAGWWAANTHAPALRAIEGVEIVAACRRDPVRMKEFAEVVGVKSVTQIMRRCSTKNLLSKVLEYNIIKTAVIMI